MAEKEASKDEQLLGALTSTLPETDAAIIVYSSTCALVMMGTRLQQHNASNVAPLFPRQKQFLLPACAAARQDYTPGRPKGVP